MSARHDAGDAAPPGRDPAHRAGPSARRVRAVVGLALALVACDPSPRVSAARERPRSPTTASTRPTAADAGQTDAAGAAPEPLASDDEDGSPIVELPVEGHRPAVVSLPLGAVAPRPVLVAAHGNYDRPEWQCSVWRAILGNRAFVLCPRGFLRTDIPPADAPRFSYRSGEALGAEIAAGLAALRARYGAHVDGGPVVYAGFSLGAIYGPESIVRARPPIARAVLVEGSHAQWTAARARAFARGGGRRVLFACGQAGCVGAARGAIARLARAGVEGRVVHGEGAGHAYGGAVAAAIRGEIDWLLDGDPRFARTWSR